MHYQFLDWDSQFFGIKVANIPTSDLGPPELATVIEALKIDEYKMAYWAAEQELSCTDAHNLGGILVDLKTTYRVDLQSIELVAGDVSTSVATYSGRQENSVLESLAIQAGEYSRFAVDPNFSEEKVSALYRVWMNNAIQGIGTKEILVIREKGEIAGMITLGEKEGSGHIGLLAVDQHFRGARLGGKLVRAAQVWFKNHDYHYCQVVTQGKNLAACALYEKCNFAMSSRRYFYHFWL